MRNQTIGIIALGVGAVLGIAAHAQQNNQNVANPNGAIPVLDLNNASYTAAGTATASGTLPLPAGVTVPRGVLAYCATGTGGTTMLTLSGGGTVPWVIGLGTQDVGKSATAATAVTGCTFQDLY